MDIGAFWTDALLDPNELTFAARFDLATRLDGPRRNCSQGQVAERMPFKRDDVIAADRELVAKGIVTFHETGGGKYGKGRRLATVDARFELNGHQWTYQTPGQLVRIKAASKKGGALRAAYHALVCREQIRYGRVLLSDADAARMLGLDPEKDEKKVAGARRALVTVGEMVAVGSHGRSVIYELPYAKVKPDADRFRPGDMAQQRVADRANPPTGDSSTPPQGTANPSTGDIPKALTSLQVQTLPVDRSSLRSDLSTQPSADLFELKEDNPFEEADVECNASVVEDRGERDAGGLPEPDRRPALETADTDEAADERPFAEILAELEANPISEDEKQRRREQPAPF